MASTSLRDDLQQQIQAGQVVAIVGAGVSVGATNNHAVASWQGLLHHGVDYCRMLPTTGVTDATAQLLHSQIDAGDLDMMLAAAEVISAKLGAPQGGEWRRWLRETVGELRAQRRDVLEALRDLGVILATTNYDGLIEEVTGLPAVTWRDGARVERVLRGDETGVLHLHGYWQQPESVILGIRDYEKVLGDAHAQTMQHAMRSFKTLLFVGCGEGLHDPNFGALLQWSAKVFAGSEYRHFRLARDGDVASLQAQHPAEQRIFVLGYGPDHSGLAVFLRRVRPAPGSKATQTEALAPARPAMLPPAPRCFGRDTEIDELVATLLAATPEPVPILGPPGIGKSTITLVALNDARVAARYGQRRVFVRCDAIRTREALAAEIATALGLPLGPQIEPALFAELASAPTALAIDNAETPWEADTLRVEEFLAALAALPGLALIASLRGASRPVGVPWRQPLQPPSLPLPDARKVFLAIAGDHFATDPLLDQVLLALDGVPLAITLMAGAAEGQPDLDGTWRRWQDERTKMLQRASATHRLLNIEVSYEISIQGPRMTDEARRLLSLLSFLPGGVAHGDLDAVFPGQGARAATILRQVGLAFDQDRRLRLLAPLREYVQARTRRRRTINSRRSRTTWAWRGRSVKKPAEKAGPKPSRASRRKSPTSRSPSCEDSTNPPPKRPSEQLSALASSPDSPVWGQPPHSNRRRRWRKRKGPLISPPNAFPVWATSPWPAPTMTPPARTTKRPGRSTNASATSSARPTASKAWATSPSAAPTMTPPARTTKRPGRSTNASAPSSARPTASKAWATSPSPLRP